MLLYRVDTTSILFTLGNCNFPHAQVLLQQIIVSDLGGTEVL